MHKLFKSFWRDNNRSQTIRHRFMQLYCETQPRISCRKRPSSKPVRPFKAFFPHGFDVWGAVALGNKMNSQHESGCCDILSCYWYPSTSRLCNRKMTRFLLHAAVSLFHLNIACRKWKISQGFHSHYTGPSFIQQKIDKALFWFQAPA